MNIYLILTFGLMFNQITAIPQWVKYYFIKSSF
jgi:hypothetical protein